MYSKEELLAKNTSELEDIARQLGMERIKTSLRRMSSIPFLTSRPMTAAIPLLQQQLLVRESA